MKRNQELLDELLLRVCDDQKTRVSGYSEQQRTDHLAMLVDDGLVDGDVNRGGDRVIGVIVHGLTAAGQNECERIKKKRGIT